jgi:CysZ protein
VRDFATGLRLFGRAVLLLLRLPRLLALGIAPALVTMVLFGAGFVVLLTQLGDLATWLTPFAGDWPTSVRHGVRALAGGAVLVTAMLLGVVSYTAVTLLIGGPCYEYLSETVEDRLGGPPPAPGIRKPGGWTLLLRGTADSVLLIAASLACGVPLLAAGFLPVVGQTAVPVLAVGIGSWLLALELVGVPFHRRGLRLRDRHRALRGRRLLTLGTAVPAYLLCAVPFLAAIVMPVAVVGGTLLAREVLAGPDPVSAGSGGH